MIIISSMWHVHIHKQFSIRPSAAVQHVIHWNSVRKPISTADARCYIQFTHIKHSKEKFATLKVPPPPRFNSLNINWPFEVSAHPHQLVFLCFVICFFLSLLPSNSLFCFIFSVLSFITHCLSPASSIPLWGSVATDFPLPSFLSFTLSCQINQCSSLYTLPNLIFFQTFSVSVAATSWSVSLQQFSAEVCSASTKLGECISY